MPALILALSAIAAAGCGSSGGGDAGTAKASTVSSQTNTQSSTSNGSQSSSTTQSSGSVSQSSMSTGRGAIQTYAGTSDATVTVTLDHASRLLWSNDKGKPFRLTGAGQDVNSTAGSGEVPLSAGHHRLSVHGALWTLVIRPS